MQYTITEINANDILPVHDVRDENKLETIYDDMAERGWNGRPLLVFEDHGGFGGMTGAHRLAAAQSLDLNIPCVVVNITDWPSLDKQMLLGADDDQRYSIFYDKELAEAASLMAEELAANEAEYAAA